MLFYVHVKGKSGWYTRSRAVDWINSCRDKKRNRPEKKNVSQLLELFRLSFVSGLMKDIYNY